MVGTKVFLELFVKIKAGWRDSRTFVEELDWRRQLQQIGGYLIRRVRPLGRDAVGRVLPWRPESYRFQLLPLPPHRRWVYGKAIGLPAIQIKFAS